MLVNDRPLVYLACPYSHDDYAIRVKRFNAVCRAAARLIREGEPMVFSPISHSHPISEHGLPTNWEFWEPCDRAYLSCCHKLIVLKLDGWRESRGVTAEIEIASEMGIPVEYLEADYVETSTV